MVKVVLFDWSGTLCNDYTDVTGLFSVKTITPDISRSIYFLPLTRALRHCLAYFEIRFPKFLLKQNSPFQNSKLFPHTKELLKFIKSKDIIIGIISTQSEDVINYIVNKSGIVNYIDFVEGRSLHKGILIKNIIKKYNLRTKDIFYITDLSDDILEIKGLGIKTCAVTWGYDDEEKLKKTCPDAIISLILELKVIL